MHRLPHAPQFVLLCCVSTQRPRPIIAPGMHCVSPAAQVHVPSTQAAPTSQAIPHPPQFAAFVLVSMHAETIIPPRPAPTMHKVRPPVPHPARQTPFWQVVPTPQRLPQTPQLASSAFVFVHVIPHCTSPGLHAHAPFAQLPPMAHCWLHAPQLRLSLVVFTHEPLHVVSAAPPSVAVHVVVHVPLLHTWPAAHAMPQPPQFCGSLAIAVQAPPLHGTPPLAQAHVPAVHCLPEAQRVLHVPQLALSLWPLMHTPPQKKSPAGQTHWLFEQT